MAAVSDASIPSTIHAKFTWSKSPLFGHAKLLTSRAVARKDTVEQDPP